MSKNIAFVANGQKGPFFELISKSILKKNSSINIYWICTGKSQYDFLVSKGWSPEKILLINWEIRKEEREPIGEYKLNELLWADRRLKHYYIQGLAYLTNLQTLFYDFVKNKDLRYIFGEMTWAHEILMNRICQDKFYNKCWYLHPQSIRIPNGRFTFMDTEFQDRIFSRIENVHPEDEIEKFTIPIIPKVPQRVAEVARDVAETLTFRYKINRILGFLLINRLKKRTQDTLQSLRPPLKERIRKFFTIEHNKYYYIHRVKKVKLENLIDKKIFFITLHMQPEASVDVVGRYYEDQLLLIKNVWRILPKDYYLVIKEHTNAIGNRGKFFFEECLKLKNAVVVDENVSSHDLIHIAEAIFSNSGTVALEGALYKKDVFLFSNIFFDKIKYCHKISLEDLKFTSNYFDLLKICKMRDKDKMEIEEYSRYILRSSFNGVIDPHTNSFYYTDPDNIEDIANSFLLFFSHTMEYANF